jgi:hypothetical protein
MIKYCNYSSNFIEEMQGNDFYIYRIYNNIFIHVRNNEFNNNE